MSTEPLDEISVSLAKLFFCIILLIIKIVNEKDIDCLRMFYIELIKKYFF